MDAAADLPPRTILLTRLNGKAAAREDRKRSDYRKRPMSRQRHYWLYRDTSLPLDCNNVWCIHKERVHLHRGRNACIIKPAPACVRFLVHTRAVARGVCIPLKSVERRKEARPGCRSHEDGKRGRKGEKELYARTTYVVTLRSTHGSKGFTDGIPHTRREGHIGRGSHTVSHDLLACHPPDLLSSSSHGWSKIRSEAYRI